MPKDVRIRVLHINDKNYLGCFINTINRDFKDHVINYQYLLYHLKLIILHSV